MKRNIVIGGALALLVLVLGVGGYQWWRARTAKPPVVAMQPPPAGPAPEAAPAAPASEPSVRHPIESLPSVPPAGSEPAPQSGDSIKTALDELLGARSVLGFLLIDGIVARIVATVDNLGREQAPAHLWPVQPTPGRFGTVPADGGALISADNAKRYEPFVNFVDSIDTPRAVALYVKLYPQFQQAYAALGFPKRYFNDRLIEVIDSLLAAPVPSGPVAVKLVEVKGPIESTRPWTRYEYADPALEALPSGQKIMMRVGPDNALRLKAKLAEFRRGIASGAAPR